MRISPSASSLVLQAPAKLNLSLEIVAKRADGYHELETLMVTVSLYDTLRLSLLPHAAPEIELCCQSTLGGSPVPPSAENLVVRAARLLQEQTGCRQGARIELLKRIPSEAGLGGGSSDAAATLMGLNQLWRLDLARDELCRIGALLGSDIPFFLHRTTAAVCRGRGEVVEPIDAALNLNFVIAKPARGLSTAEVYRHCRVPEAPQGAGPLVDALRSARLAHIARRLRNALQAPAERLNPDVTRTLSQLGAQSNLGLMMSGSGSACFAISATYRQALTVAARLRTAGNDRVYAVQSRP
jgi:4-diphosphocytidyl-2-C-methyl-D-erythritol kinase